MSDVTFIIPITSKNIDAKILNYNIKKMREVSNKIVVIATSDIELPEESEVDFVTFDDKERAKLIQQALNFAHTEYVWINEYNFILDYKKAYEVVNGQDMINPCKEKYFLTKEQAKKLLEDKEVTEYEIRADNSYGKFSYIIKLDRLRYYYQKFITVMYKKGLPFFKLDRFIDRSVVTGFSLSDTIQAKVVIREEPDTNIEVREIKSNTDTDTDIKTSEVKRETTKVKPKVKPKVKSNIKTRTKLKAKKTKGVTSSRNVKSYRKVSGTVFNDGEMESGTYPIVHVTNIPPEPNEELKKRTELAMTSVEQNHIDEVLLLNCGTTEMEREGWTFQLLERDSKTELNNNKDVPFLKDLLDQASKHCHPNGYLLYTNSDCGISEHIYKDLLEFNGLVKEYQRKDIEDNPTTLDELYNNRFEVFYIGVDGIAIKSRYYNEIRDELPDVVIGDPFWDPAISGILKKMTKVVQESFDLYHPNHPQVWDVANMKPAGMHNYQIYNDALQYGQSDLECIREDTDTGLVIVNYGKDPLRLNATEKAFKELVKQELNFKIYWVECLYEGTKSNYSDFITKHPRVEHILIQGTDKNKDLWQKECLMNIGARAVKEDNIIFVDNDIYSNDLRWLKKIRDKLIDNRRNVVHGYFVSQDTEDPRLNYQSLGSLHIFQAETDLDINPGLCWGITKSFFDSMDGLNPFFIDGGGDSGFVCEYLNTDNNAYDSYLFRFNWYQKIYRKMKVKGKLECVDSDIVHCNHGKFATRNYNTIRYALDELKQDIQDFCRIDDKGLLEWVDPECPERRIIKRRPEMFDNEKMREIVKNEYK